MVRGTSTTERDESGARSFERTLAVALRSVRLALGRPQRERMLAHYRMLVAGARRFNLTRITAPAEAAVRHYADSLALLARPEVVRLRAVRVLDVGTGAGFPAVPLAIARGDWRVTAIDGTGKKVRFVAECAEQLGIGNLRAVHARCEDLPGEGDPFDLICFRAVDKLPACFRLGRPLLADRGLVVCWKAGRIEAAEWRAGLRAAERLGLSAPESWAYRIEGLASPLEHQLVMARLPAGPTR